MSVVSESDTNKRRRRRILTVLMYGTPIICAEYSSLDRFGRMVLRALSFLSRREFEPRVVLLCTLGAWKKKERRI